MKITNRDSPNDIDFSNKPSNWDNTNDKLGVALWASYHTSYL